MTSEPSKPTIEIWRVEPLAADVANALERTLSSDDVHHVAVMPDVHLAGDVCNGTVVATKELIYPQAVGGDIGCGMLALAIDLGREALSSEQSAGRLMEGIYRAIPSNKHSAAKRPAQLPTELDEIPLSARALERMAGRDGLFQLGTLGRGNHFVEVQADSDDRLWLMVHSGSRAMGQAITAHHVQLSFDSRTGLQCLDAALPEGQAYLNDLNWAIEYAWQNRLAMSRVVEQLFRSLFNSKFDWSTLIHCHHNHVQREVHHGEELWIHRKGALPAAEGQAGVIPGSMGSRSFHVTGRGCESALKSSSHGAGRISSRHQARQRVTGRELQRQMQGVWYDHRLKDILRDESPAAYRDIGRVMRAQQDLTRIERQLQPVLVYKGT